MIRRCPQHVIIFVSLMHIIWAALLLMSPAEVSMATPIAAVVNLVNGINVAAVILAGVGVLALAAMLRRRHRPVWMLIPQQVLLIISAAGGVSAVARGHYADGTIRPWQFILGDQLPIIIIALLYTTAILAVARNGGCK